MAKWWENITVQQPTKVAVEKLSFDPDNPRLALADEFDSKNEIDIIKLHIERSDLSELLESIATSGYVDIEPMVVLGVGTKLLVLEGNRRLAALKVLRSPEIAKSVSVAIPSMSAAVKRSLSTVSVYRVLKREDARDFIGFKHINGPHRWDSIAKAQFAARWYRDEKSNGVTLKDIAKRMGDRHDTIQRMVAGILVLEQAEKHKLFRPEERYPGRQFAFSHLYTALTRPGYREFLGLPDDWRQNDPKPDPVPKGKLENLKRVLVWLYGSREDEVKPVVTSQNPHIKNLGEVLEHAKARTIMLARNNLDVAYSEVSTPLVQFEQNLVDSHSSVEQTLRKVAAYDGVDSVLLEIAQELSGSSKVIFETMERKFKERNKRK